MCCDIAMALQFLTPPKQSAVDDFSLFQFFQSATKVRTHCFEMPAYSFQGTTRHCNACNPCAHAKALLGFLQGLPDTLGD